MKRCICIELKINMFIKDVYILTKIIIIVSATFYYTAFNVIPCFLLYLLFLQWPIVSTIICIHYDITKY